MAWERLAHVELSSGASSINSGTITAKKNIRIIFSGVGTNASSYPRIQFNSDTGNNYVYRQSADGGTDNTQTSQNHINTTGNVGAFHHYFVADISNKSGEEKLVIVKGMDSNTSGAANAPRSREVTGKWVTKTGQITSVQVTDLGGHDFAAGSYITVLGAKEAATSDTMSVTDLTAKKHLMIQAKCVNSGAVRTGVRFNNDTGNNYAHRRSVNGASDATNTSHNRIVSDTDIDGTDFTTIYVLNEASKEKLVILERVHQSGSGAGNAPDREEMVGKWVNTSNAITRVDIVNTETGDFVEGSEVTVYGTD